MANAGVGTIIAVSLGLGLAACGGRPHAAASPQSTPGPAPVGVRAIDWRNRPYQSTMAAEQPRLVVVHDNEGEIDHGEDIKGWVHYSEAIYGDVTGDGVEEAIIIVGESGGGTGIFDAAEIYQVKDGQPERIGVIVGSDRADGGIADVAIVSGAVRLTRHASEHSGACCPDHTQIERWSWNGTALVEDRRKREYVEVSGDSP